MPARPVRPTVAVVGCGSWGQNLVRNFASMGCLAAVTDTCEDTAARTSAEFAVAARTLEEVLAEPGIDAVVIATPASSHAELASAAHCERGSTCSWRSRWLAASPRPKPSASWPTGWAEP